VAAHEFEDPYDGRRYVTVSRLMRVGAG
jgi:hypothetical protein